MFKIFDKNGDGSISSAEMQSLMQTFGENITDAEANEVIKEADTSGDGRFTFEEFKAFMKWSAWFSEFWFSLISNCDSICYEEIWKKKLHKKL